MKLVSVTSPKAVEVAAPAKQGLKTITDLKAYKWVGNAHSDAKAFDALHKIIVGKGPESDKLVALKLIDKGMGLKTGKVTKKDIENYIAETDGLGEEASAKEEAKGVVRKLIDKARRKIKGRKDTGHPLGNDLQDLMGQYAELKKAGKGDSKKAKAIGAQIGKIKNSLRGGQGANRKKEEAAVKPSLVKHRKLSDVRTQLREIGMTIKVEDGEFGVNFKGGKESTTYYTNDLQDALTTGHQMSKQKK